MNIHARSRARSRAPSPGPCGCRRSLPIHLRWTVICCFLEMESRNINSLVLIPFSLARDARGRFATGSSGNPRGRPRGIPNPRRRVPDLVAPAAERAGAVGSARPQAAPVAPARRAAVAAAARCHRPGDTSGDRRGVVAHSQRFPAGAVRRSDGRCARRSRARRGRANRTAGACPVARAPPPRTVGVRSAHPMRRAD
jgi:hypothetical protein